LIPPATIALAVALDGASARTQPALMRCLLAFATALVAFLTPAAELKVATLDLDRALTNHHKLEAGLQRIRTQEVSFGKELDRLRLEGRRLQQELESLQQEAEDSVLSAAARVAKKQVWEQRRVDFSSFRVRYEQFEVAGVEDLRGQAARLRRALTDEVLGAARQVGERDGFNFIFHANRFAPAAGDVLFSRGVEDVTDRVIAVMNAAPGPSVPGRRP